eukprot:4301820-Pyramimonas_sp.AAC.1
MEVDGLGGDVGEGVADALGVGAVGEAFDALGTELDVLLLGELVRPGLEARHELEEVIGRLSVLPRTCSSSSQ